MIFKLCFSSPTPGSENEPSRLVNRSTSSEASNKRSASLQQMIRDTNNASLMFDEQALRRVSDQLHAMKIELPTNPKQLLRRMLSVHTIVSTSSSWATKQQSAVGESLAFRKIGFGLTGVVFDNLGSVSAMKVARDARYGCEMLWNDYKMQCKVYEAFAKAGELEVRVPKPFAYMNQGLDDICKTWWMDNAKRFLDNTSITTPSDLIEMERISPLPKITRAALIEV